MPRGIPKKKFEQMKKTSPDETKAEEIIRNSIANHELNPVNKPTIGAAKPDRPAGTFQEPRAFPQTEAENDALKRQPPEPDLPPSTARMGRREIDQAAERDRVAREEDSAKARAAEEADQRRAKPLVPVKLNRDYWAGTELRDQWDSLNVTPDGLTCRFGAGSVLYLDGKEARRLIGTGVADRNDPLPDEMD
jgi:hypothetical protein